MDASETSLRADDLIHALDEIVAAFGGAFAGRDQRAAAGNLIAIVLIELQQIIEPFVQPGPNSAGDYASTPPGKQPVNKAVQRTIPADALSNLRYEIECAR